MVYQEYPRHLHKPGGAYKVVHDDDEKAAALEAGWSLQPVVEGVTPAPAPQDDAPAPEAAAPIGVVPSSPLAVGAGQTGESITVEASADKPKRGRKPKQ